MMVSNDFSSPSRCLSGGSTWLNHHHHTATTRPLGPCTAKGTLLVDEGSSSDRCGAVVEHPFGSPWFTRRVTFFAMAPWQWQYNPHQSTTIYIYLYLFISIYQLTWVTQAKMPSENSRRKVPVWRPVSFYPFSKSKRGIGPGELMCQWVCHSDSWSRQRRDSRSGIFFPMQTRQMQQMLGPPYRFLKDSVAIVVP